MGPPGEVGTTSRCFVSGRSWTLAVGADHRKNTFVEVDRSAYDAWLAPPPHLDHGYAYTPMSNFVGESDLPGVLKRSGINFEVNPKALASSFASIPQSASSGASAVYIQPENSINPLVPYRQVLEDTPPSSEPEIPYPIDHTPQTFYPSNFNTPGPAPLFMAGAASFPLPHNAPATPAYAAPAYTTLENVSNMGKVQLQPENCNILASSETQSKKERCVNRGHDLFKILGLSH